ncbi:hypothetical protein Ahy_A05g025384 [Arachis hypogaea]|uniref:N-acetyltransferase domain-containing protein n=1 Tax=Arachis hypogaea TaxID=3818 RepID=A0A445D8K1_ARAHY|nr:hypothetical protein Ahy_A05g025384 [Arachis hypogaea]
MSNLDLSKISLRPFKLSDVDDFLLWAGDDQVTQNLRWKTCGSREEALAFIRDVCIPHPWRRSICLDDRSIGFVSVYPWSGDDRCKADIGYAVAADYWGQGIATKAVKMAVPQVFNDLSHLVRLQAFTSPENKASQRVVEKAGFLKEGEHSNRENRRVRAHRNSKLAIDIFAAASAVMAVIRVHLLSASAIKSNCNAQAFEIERKDLFGQLSSANDARGAFGGNRGLRPVPPEKGEERIFGLSENCGSPV